MPGTVTFYRGYCQTLCCLPGIISLIIMCIGIIFFQIMTFRRWTCLTGLRLGLNSGPRPLYASRSTAHGAQVDHSTTRAGLLNWVNVVYRTYEKRLREFRLLQNVKNFQLKNLEKETVSALLCCSVNGICSIFWCHLANVYKVHCTCIVVQC